jgi:hypothetical protein
MAPAGAQGPLPIPAFGWSERENSLGGPVQRRMALCAYGITQDGYRELIDFLLVRAESEDTWHNFLSELWRRGLKGAVLKLAATDGHPGLIKALARLWPRLAHQRCWAHKLRNLENKLKASQRSCLEEAKLIYQAEHGKAALKSNTIVSRIACSSVVEVRGGDFKERPAFCIAWRARESWFLLTCSGARTFSIFKTPTLEIE